MNNETLHQIGYSEFEKYMQDYPISKYWQRDILNENIYNYYEYLSISINNREIWLSYLRARMAIIMPKYNLLYDSLKLVDDIDPLINFQWWYDHKHDGSKESTDNTVTDYNQDNTKGVTDAGYRNYTETMDDNTTGTKNSTQKIDDDTTGTRSSTQKIDDDTTGTKNATTDFDGNVKTTTSTNTVMDDDTTETRDSTDSAYHYFSDTPQGNLYPDGVGDSAHNGQYQYLTTWQHDTDVYHHDIKGTDDRTTTSTGTGSTTTDDLTTYKENTTGTDDRTTTFNENTTGTDDKTTDYTEKTTGTDDYTKKYDEKNGNQQDTVANQTSNQNVDDTYNYSESEEDHDFKRGTYTDSLSTLITKYRELAIDIDRQIIIELDDLFATVFDLADLNGSALYINEPLPHRVLCPWLWY